MAEWGQTISKVALESLHFWEIMYRALIRILIPWELINSISLKSFKFEALDSFVSFQANSDANIGGFQYNW